MTASSGKYFYSPKIVLTRKNSIKIYVFGDINCGGESDGGAGESDSVTRRFVGGEGRCTYDWSPVLILLSKYIDSARHPWRMCTVYNINLTTTIL